MRLKSTEKLSHENVYKCYDDKISTDPEDFKKSSRGGRGGGRVHGVQVESRRGS